MQKMTAKKLRPFLALLCKQTLLNDGLGRDAGVVGAGHPQGLVALHAVDPDQGVLERVVERVSQVQRRGHVRRGNQDAGEVLSASSRGVR